VETGAQFQLLVLPSFMPAAAVVANFQQVQLVETAAVETELHQAQEQAELQILELVVAVVELLERRETAEQVDQVLSFYVTQTL
jgi:hypothetical protein